jgi:phosphohistidine phosphatase
MKLIFVRHAAAIERSTAVSDEWRYLTSEGRVFFRKTAWTMLKNGVDPGLIISSPSLRAVQTAEILAETLSFIGPLIVMDELSPGLDMSGLEKIISGYRSVDELVLVGHEPDFSSLVSGLLGLPSGFNFKKGSAVKLSVNTKNTLYSSRFKWMAMGKKFISSRKDAFASEDH